MLIVFRTLLANSYVGGGGVVMWCVFRILSCSLSYLVFLFGAMGHMQPRKLHCCI